MSNKTKIISLIVIVLILIVGFSMKNDSNQSESLTLGLMLPLTGDYAAAGQNMQKGMEVALDQYRKENPDASIKVVIEDDAYDAKKGVSAYKKLVDLDKVDMILMLSTPVIDAIHEDVVARGIPMIQLGVQTVGVADDNIIQFSPAAEAPIGFLATHLSDSAEYTGKKVAVIYDNASAQISFFDAFKKSFKHDFTPFVVNSKNDLRSYATKIANENFDVVVVIESPENGALFAKELLTLDSTMPVLAFDAQLQTGFADYTRILGDANKINGAKSMWFKAGKMDVVNDLYKQKYGEAPGFLVDFSYDMVNVALATYDANDADWVKNLKKFSDANGASGSISFDKNGVRIQPMVITEVRNGALVPTE